MVDFPKEYQSTDYQTMSKKPIFNIYAIPINNTKK